EQLHAGSLGQVDDHASGRGLLFLLPLLAVASFTIGLPAGARFAVRLAFGWRTLGTRHCFAVAAGFGGLFLAGFCAALLAQETAIDYDVPLALLDARLGVEPIGSLTFGPTARAMRARAAIVESAKLGIVGDAAHRSPPSTRRTGLQPPEIHRSISSRSQRRRAPSFKPLGISPRSAMRITCLAEQERRAPT